jgi:hypothetical protein
MPTQVGAEFGRFHTCPPSSIRPQSGCHIHVLSEHSQTATKHYATLRAALRALAPEPEVLGALDIDSHFRQIRSWIQQGADSPAGESQLRAKIDSALDEISTEMLAIIDRSSFWQFRATLPAVRVDSPGDLEALLQVCLSAPDRLWSDLVDYVVTLLATQEKGGRRQMEGDPASVSAYLQEICAEAAQDADEDSLALAAKIGDACEALAGDEPLAEIVQRVRELKRAAENQLLVPDVLRSVVRFNVVVGNRVLQQQEVRRSLDQAELDVISETEQSDVEAPSENVASNALPAFGSFELEAVESALQVRLARGAVIDNPAHRVAGRADLSKLTAFEKDAFRDRSNSRVSRIVRSVVTIGLVVRQAGDSSDDLEQLGIDAEWLSRSSEGEIDKLAQEGIRELTRNRGFEQAQQLAELRARYLNPLFDADLLSRATISGSGNGAGTAPIGDSSESPAAPNQRSVQRTQGAQPTSRAGVGLDTKRKSGKQQVRAGGKFGIIGIGVSVLLAVVAGVVMLTRGDGNSNATPYTNDQLSEITPYLTSGYTSFEGSATIFHGTVNAMWSRLSTDEKQQAAAEIGARMQSQGVSVVKFFDFSKKLQFHYSEGSIRHLE